MIGRLDLTSYTIFETDWNQSGIVACSENGNIYFISVDISQPAGLKIDSIF